MKKFQAVLLFLLHYLLEFSTVHSVVTLNDDTDKTALLAFKAELTNGEDALNSWNETTHYCEWIGVICSRKHTKRVSIIDLSVRGLLGNISPSIGNLTFLRGINLTSNQIYGEIPTSISFLRYLRYLDLSHNSLEGEIDTGLQNCSNLLYLNFSSNHLVGAIPSWLGSLSTLEYLDLKNNNLTGAIPSSLSNLSSLFVLSLSYNHLKGTIPVGLSFLPVLQQFRVSVNNLSGFIPHSFYNQSSLIEFYVSDNTLVGNLPVSVATNLPYLQYFILGLNHFTGPIPVWLSNASNINWLDLSDNNFSGSIPSELGKLCPMKLNVEHNNLAATSTKDWIFLKLLTNCSRLQELSLGFNNLRGTFPSYVANLSTQITRLYMGGNYLSGSIPNDIGNLINLELLSLYENQLTGNIPDSIWKLRSLRSLDLNNNMLDGSLSPSIGNLTLLFRFTVFNNNILSDIPASLGNLRLLSFLSMSNNSLYGTLPTTIFSLPSLSNVLDLSQNFLSGMIPYEIGSLKVWYLDLSKNKLHGELPQTLPNCESLVNLYLNGNLFNGTIPPFIGNLKGLQALDLSSNSFYGTIPQELSHINSLQEVDLSDNNLSGIIPMPIENLSSLFWLNLSSNRLEGPVPTKGIFANITGLSISGNIALCGGIPQLRLPICPSQHNKKISPSLFMILIIALPCVIIFIICLMTIIVLFRRRVESIEKETTKSIILEESYPKVSYGELVKATEGFSVDNLLGSGTYGSVYKGILPFKYKHSTYHAIKVFNLEVQGTSRSFLAECDALKMIRHRNLVSLITCCSSTDFKGNDFKALVFDFMPKGSLERWLHREESPFLSFIERLNIIIDVADAVDYLHNNCEPSIIHCDLKPSNILLNEDLVAHVGDFGLAKLLPTSIQLLNSQSSMGIRGTIGYIAPEYGGGGPVSTRADVYSFGIILLEMFTCRTPTDNMFKDGLTLHTFVETAFPERLHDIMDPNLISSRSDSDLEIQNEQEGDSWNKIHEFLGSVIRVGLMCSKQTPAERKSIKDAAFELHSIRDAYVRVH